VFRTSELSQTILWVTIEGFGPTIQSGLGRVGNHHLYLGIFAHGVSIDIRCFVRCCLLPCQLLMFGSCIFCCEPGLLALCLRTSSPHTDVAGIQVLPSTPVLCYIFANALPAFIIVASVTYILTFVYLLPLTRSKDEFLLLSPLHLLYILPHDKCSISKLFHVSFCEVDADELQRRAQFSSALSMIFIFNYGLDIHPDTAFLTSTSSSLMTMLFSNLLSNSFWDNTTQDSNEFSTDGVQKRVFRAFFGFLGISKNIATPSLLLQHTSQLVHNLPISQQTLYTV
jgi:hypothetical protein